MALTSDPRSSHELLQGGSIFLLQYVAVLGMDRMAGDRQENDPDVPGASRVM